MRFSPSSKDGAGGELAKGRRIGQTKPRPFTSTKSPQPATQNGNFEFPQAASQFLAGSWGGHVGSFMPVTYDSQADHFTWDNTDIRYANINGHLFGKPLTYGAMLEVDRFARRTAGGSEQRVARPKIFGIGLSKTGTTSLHFALELLGFRSAHASTLFSHVLNKEATNRRPLLSTLEAEFDAFIDWPISYLYPLLDRRFPKSKFILTIRNPLQRYRSAQQHVEEDRRRRVHGLSHAWVEIEPEKEFIAEDSRHTGAVMSYFEGRSKDLLVMAITEGDGWGKLCEFLGLPPRSDPFPRHCARGSHQSHFVGSLPVVPGVVAVNLAIWMLPSVLSS
jgi:hypothetical protein